MATTNTRYLVTSRGSALTASKAPIPVAAEIGPNELVIRIRAVAINPADFKMIDLGHRVQSWPLVAGLDGAGEVVTVGANVSRFVIGDGVLAAFTTGEKTGSFQEFAVVDECKVAKKPEFWSFEEAAGVAVCYITALVGLVKGLGVTPFFSQSQGTCPQKPLKSVLVLGGSSAVGAAAVQLLRLSLPPDTIILTTSALRHHRRTEEFLGASKAIDRASPSLVQDIKRATPDGRGVDVIIDTVGAGAKSVEVFGVLTEDGPRRYAQVWTGGEEVSVPDGIESVMFRSRDLSTLQDHEQVMSALESVLKEGKYKLPLPVKVVSGTGLEALKAGLNLVRDGVSGEKIVVRMSRKP